MGELFGDVSSGSCVGEAPLTLVSCPSVLAPVLTAYDYWSCQFSLWAAPALNLLTAVSRPRSSKASLRMREIDASKRSRILKKSNGTHGLKFSSSEHKELRPNRE